MQRSISVNKSNMTMEKDTIKINLLKKREEILQINVVKSYYNNYYDGNKNKVRSVGIESKIVEKKCIFFL
jgi:hypothetical protein